MRNEMRTYMLLMSLLLMVTAARAQFNPNPFEQGTRFYEVFDIAYTHRYDSLCLAYADTLEQCSKASRDTLGHCMAYSLRSYYYIRRGTRQELQASTRKYREVAERYGMTNLLFDGYHREINWLVNRDYFTPALNLAEEMQERAYAQQDPYGIYSCYRILAHIQYYHGNFISALRDYLSAIDYGRHNVSNKSFAAEYYYAASCCYYLGDYRRGIALCDSVFTGPRASRPQKISAYSLRSTLKYLVGDIAGFLEDRESAMQFTESAKYRITGIAAGRNDIFYLLETGQTDSARNYVEHMPSMVERPFSAKRDYHIAIDDYEDACFDMDSILMRHFRQVKTIYDRGFASLNVSLSEIGLRLESADLELQRNMLLLQNKDLEISTSNIELLNTQLELERVQERLDAQQAFVNYNSLRESNQQLRHAQQQLEAEKTRSELELQTDETLHQKYMFSIMLLIFILVIIISIIIIVYRRRQMKKLVLSNHRLVVARQHAEEMRQKAEHSEKMKALFMQNMSHEIRTPLNAICGFSQIIADPDAGPAMDPAVKHEFSELILHNSELLTTLVNDILYVSDLQSGHYRLNNAPVSVNAICRDALRAVLNRRRPEVEMFFESTCQDDFVITTDRLRVQQVLTNYLTNAIKHTDSGEICLRCELSDDKSKVIFSVSDTGDGVPADKAEIIFGRFEKLDTFRQGTGLGLAICRLIAEMFGGRVYLDTNYHEEGSRFVFELPLAA